VLLALQRATHRTLRSLADDLSALDITASEINVLANLADGRTRTVRELGLDTGTKATTLTGVLDRLERRGYLARDLDPADRRSFRITLTATGIAASADVLRAISELEHHALGRVPDRDLRGYHAVIAALLEDH
jgi:DNA-binding MarR family transcriptional regulator